MLYIILMLSIKHKLSQSSFIDIKPKIEIQTQTRIQEPCNVKQRDFRDYIHRLEGVKYCRIYVE